LEIKKAKQKTQPKKENKPGRKHSPYLCDLCDFRRNKDDPDKKGFKCNTDKRRSRRYKGCPDIEIGGGKPDAVAKKTQKTVAGTKTKKEK